ncbi:hypothetical protein FQN54_009001 [Arachnomyces sp. PD_36]|nr:hypothetical protein FQN54_009001 [Arachnomyces sp. PD_36]
MGSTSSPLKQLPAPRNRAATENAPRNDSSSSSQVKQDEDSPQAPLNPRKRPRSPSDSSSSGASSPPPVRNKIAIDPRRGRGRGRGRGRSIRGRPRAGIERSSRSDISADSLPIRPQPARRDNSDGMEEIEPSVPPQPPQPDGNQRVEESKSYEDIRYEQGLALRGSFMRRSGVGINGRSWEVCDLLMNRPQTIPFNTRFTDDLFLDTCEMIRYANKRKIMADVGPLIVPAAESLSLQGETALGIYTESVSESWIRCVPFYGPCPKPDYAVGFKRCAFSRTQLERLQPYLGGLDHLSYFMATDEIYFPFFSTEVQSSATGNLDVADRINAHTMTVAVKGVVELFRAVNREDEVHRELLAFSVSYDALMVRIYGYYPVIEGRNTTIHRHPIRLYYYADGRTDRWISNRFTQNLYDTWAPAHLGRIGSAINELPAVSDTAQPILGPNP